MEEVAAGQHPLCCEADMEREGQMSWYMRYRRYRILRHGDVSFSIIAFYWKLRQPGRNKAGLITKTGPWHVGTLGTPMVHFTNHNKVMRYDHYYVGRYPWRQWTNVSVECLARRGLEGTTR